MRRLILIAALAAAGCATATSIRSGRSFFEGSTLKATEQITGCIATAWGQAGFNLRTEVTPERSSVILSGSTVVGSDIVADVLPNGRVLMFERKAGWASLDDRLRDQVRACL